MYLCSHVVLARKWQDVNQRGQGNVYLEATLYPKTSCNSKLSPALHITNIVEQEDRASFVREIYVFQLEDPTAKLSAQGSTTYLETMNHLTPQATLAACWRKGEPRTPIILKVCPERAIKPP
jgi:hypothetical protein